MLSDHHPVFAGSRASTIRNRAVNEPQNPAEAAVATQAEILLEDFNTASGEILKGLKQIAISCDNARTLFRTVEEYKEGFIDRLGSSLGKAGNQSLFGHGIKFCLWGLLANLKDPQNEDKAAIEEIGARNVDMPNEGMRT